MAVTVGSHLWPAFERANDRGLVEWNNTLTTRVWLNEGSKHARAAGFPPHIAIENLLPQEEEPDWEPCDDEVRELEQNHVTLDSEDFDWLVAAVDRLWERWERLD